MGNTTNPKPTCGTTRNPKPTCGTKIKNEKKVEYNRRDAY
jgi:hypothetical protein